MEATAFNTYFWSKSWPLQDCHSFWSPVKLLAGKDEYVNIYSSTSPSYLQWYPGRCDGQLGSLIRSGGAGEPNRDPSSPCVKAVLASGDFQLADSKGDKIGRKKNVGKFCSDSPIIVFYFVVYLVKV